MRVAYIGLGIMGAAMAANIARAGHRVLGYNRSPRDQAALGFAIAANLAQAVADAEIICLCLDDEASVAAVLLDPGGVVDHAAPGALIVDFTTIGPEAAREIAGKLARRGLSFIDAPVTGGDVGAREASLTVMLGGERADIARARPILDAVGRKSVVCGPVGAGQAAKMVNQLLCAVNLMAACEAMRLAERLGVTPPTVVEACGGGAAASWQLNHLGEKAAKGDFAPGFRLRHMVKDLRLAAADDLPGFALARGLFDQVLRDDPELGEAGTQALMLAYTSTCNRG